MTFRERVLSVIEKNQSYVCVGLDTDLSKIPAHLTGSRVERMIAFNKAIIDATSDISAAYKLNSAFYEAEGPEGARALEECIEMIPESVITIVDAKRGDIGNTAEQYAKAVFDRQKADAVTLNPYMGSDSVLPFLNYESKGSFILCLTSNKSGADIQKISTLSNGPVYAVVAELISSWNKNDNAGMVVGATKPEELSDLRKIVPTIPLLIPGIGAQGGDLEKTVLAGIGFNLAPALINSSRGIIYASSGEDFAEVSRSECDKLRVAINAILAG